VAILLVGTVMGVVTAANIAVVIARIGHCCVLAVLKIRDPKPPVKNVLRLRNVVAQPGLLCVTMAFANVLIHPR